MYTPSRTFLCAGRKLRLILTPLKSGSLSSRPMMTLVLELVLGRELPGRTRSHTTRE